MPKRLRDISHLPGWPALLSAEQAATYGGMSPENFEALVKSEVFPAPVKLPIRLRLWSRATIDAALATAEKQARESETTAIARRFAQEIIEEGRRTPAERKARRVQARQAHAERAAARAQAAAEQGSREPRD